MTAGLSSTVVTTIGNLLQTGARLFFDVARMIPGLSSVLGLEPVIVDGLALSELVMQDAILLMATPEWAKFAASAKAFFENKGGSVTTALAPNLAGTPTVVIGYNLPPHTQTPTELNLWEKEHPNG